MIQRALINPLFIITDVLGQKVNEKSFPYIHTIFENMYDIFDESFPQTTESINEMNKLLNSLQEYHDVENVDSPDFYIHAKQKLKIYVDNYRIMNFKKSDIEIGKYIIDQNIVRKELSNELDGLYDPFTIEMISDIFTSDCNFCLQIIYGGKNMSLDWNFDDDGHIIFNNIENKDTIGFIDNRKDNDMENLINNNHGLDKDHGCRLKHPKFIESPEGVYYNTFQNIKLSLITLMCNLNNLNYKKYIENDTIFGPNIKMIKLKSLIKKSQWFSNIDGDDKKFRVRFVTLLVIRICENIENIIDNCLNYNNDSKILEWEARTEYAVYTLERLSDFINKLLSCQDYKDDLIYFTELGIILENNYEKIEIIHEQSLLLSERLKKFSKYQEDISMDTILKLAYILVTPDHKVKNKVPFIEVYTFNNPLITRQLIEELGSSIIKNRKKMNLSFLYSIYADSKPQLYSKWRDINNNIKLKCGVIALHYLKFVLNDNRITKRINKLIMN